MKTEQTAYAFFVAQIFLQECVGLLEVWGLQHSLHHYLSSLSALEKWV